MLKIQGQLGWQGGLGAATWVALAISGVGCSRSESAAGAPSAPASAPASATPVSTGIRPEVVQNAVNPKGRPPYAGPTGTVRGVVRVSGDTAPIRDEVLAQIGDACAGSRAFYGPAFREGPGRALADALVAVTGYEGYVPPRGEAVRVEIDACAYKRRTYGVMFGQRLDVFNLDSQPYMPRLLRTKTAAVMVALPRGEAIPLLPPKPGRYALVDEMRSGPHADVFVLQYPTFDITELDGRFEITAVPVGEVDVSALLPLTMAAVKERVTVKAGETSEVTLTIAYERPKAEPAAKPGASAPGPVVH